MINLQRAKRRAAFIRIVIGTMIAGYPLATIAKSHITHRDQVEIAGVRAFFEVKKPLIQHGEPLIVQLRLLNTAKTSISFSFLPAFVLHVRVYDSKHKEVYRRSDAPILEPVRRDLSLRPGETVSIDNKLDLPAYYDLKPGRYYLRFVYDLRLIDDRKLFEKYRDLYHTSDYMLWDARFYPLTIKE